MTYRTPQVTQLSVHSCWSHILGGKPHLGSSPSLFCRPALEGLVSKRTEPWTCVSCLLVDTVESIIATAEICYVNRLMSGVLAK